MTSPKDNEDELIEDTDENLPEVPKPPIPVQKFSRFGPQNAGSKFGKSATNFNPPNKQRPGRAAGRGR